VIKVTEYGMDCRSSVCSWGIVFSSPSLPYWMWGPSSWHGGLEVYLYLAVKLQEPGGWLHLHPIQGVECVHMRILAPCLDTHATFV
jgi:hypothetical protein